MLASASEWWQTRFGAAESVRLASLTKELTRSANSSSSSSFASSSSSCGAGEWEKSMDVNVSELQVLLSFCFGLDAASALDDNQAMNQGHTTSEADREDFCVSQQDFLYFVSRFGPSELCLTKCVKCFYNNGRVASWFHGDMSRFHAEQVLGGHRDGTFLIRFSESHPTKFTLSYVKELPNGKRAIKNCLIENLGERGYGLIDSPNHAFSSIASFIQRSASRLKHPLPCKRAELCNVQLARIRAQAAQSDDAYSNFSTTSSSDSFVASAVSQSNTMPSVSPIVKSNNYSSFSVQSVTPPRTPPPERRPHPFSGSVAAMKSCQGPVEMDYACFNGALRARAARLSEPSSMPPSRPVGQELKGEPKDTQQQRPSTEEESSEPIQQPSIDRKLPTDSYGSFAFGSLSSSPSSSTIHKEPLSKPLSSSSQYDCFVNGSCKTSKNRVSMTKSTLEESNGCGHFAPVSISSSSNQEQDQGMVFAPPPIPIQVPPTLSVPSFSAASSSSGDGYGNFASLSFCSDSNQALTIPPSALGSGASDAYGCLSTRTQQALNAFSSSSTDDAYGNFASMSLFSDEQSTLASLPACVLPSYVTSSSKSADTDASPERINSPLAEDVINASKPQQHPVHPSASGSGGPMMKSGSSPPLCPLTMPISLPDAIVPPAPAASTSATVASTNPIEAIPVPGSIAGASTETQDENKTGDALVELNSGMGCYKNQQLDEAIDHFQRAKHFAVAKQDRIVEARALGNLGTVYLDKKLTQQAVECYTQCLEITRTINDAKRERTILNNLILALTANEDYEEALGYCQIQLQMSQSEVNRRKITARMSLLREKAKRKRQCMGRGASF